MDNGNGYCYKNKTDDVFFLFGTKNGCRLKISFLGCLKCLKSLCCVRWGDYMSPNAISWEIVRFSSVSCVSWYSRVPQLLPCVSLVP
jgi:hypothetical protein